VNLGKGQWQMERSVRVLGEYPDVFKRRGHRGILPQTAHYSVFSVGISSVFSAVKSRGTPLKLHCTLSYEKISELDPFAFDDANL
jgi:hypothetical protein